MGSVIIVLHAPPDKEIETVDEILNYATLAGFLFYSFLVTVYSLFTIYKIVPKYGHTNPMIYISICSSVGSISVMSIKAFGIALKLTFAGNNQFTHMSTYVFITVVVVCILTQMNYFNKALDQFDTSIVNPLYYVTFTTCTLVASFILFKGFNTTSAVNVISLLIGFLVIFSGVYLLNIARKEDNGFDKEIFGVHNGKDIGPMDNGVGGFSSMRRSMQMNRGEYDTEETLGLRRFDSFELGSDEDIDAHQRR